LFFALCLYELCFFFFFTSAHFVIGLELLSLHVNKKIEL
jgi:hypothetical protein